MFAGFIISHDPDGSVHQTYMQGTGPSKYVQKSWSGNQFEYNFLIQKKS